MARKLDGWKDWKQAIIWSFMDCVGSSQMGISLLAFDGNMRIIHSGRRNDMGNGPFFLE
jgi:hypothetical protein